MKTTILCADPHKDTAYMEQISHLGKGLPESCELDIIDLSTSCIHGCMGCWTCWVKTPGKCIFHDDMENIYSKIVKSDMLIFASPLIDGFVSAQLKTAMDRLIPLFSPYIRIYKKECHHKKRYPHYPKIGVLLQSEEGTDKEDLIILRQIFDRVAINMHTQLLFIKMLHQQDTQQVLYEACYF